MDEKEERRKKKTQQLDGVVRFLALLDFKSNP